MTSGSVTGSCESVWFSSTVFKVVMKRRQGDEEFEVLKERPGAWVDWMWVYVHVRSQTQLLKARHMNERRLGGSAVLL